MKLFIILNFHLGAQKLQLSLKGIVHPKITIVSSFTHPRVVPNLYECLCSAEHKGRYSEECGKQSKSGAPYLFSYYGSQWCPKTAWLQTFFKISFFVIGRTKKFIQVWNYLRVSKWWQHFHFWVNYPFKKQPWYSDSDFNRCCRNFFFHNDTFVIIDKTLLLCLILVKFPRHSLLSRPDGDPGQTWKVNC